MAAQLSLGGLYALILKVNSAILISQIQLPSYNFQTEIKSVTVKSAPQKFTHEIEYTHISNRKPTVIIFSAYVQRVEWKNWTFFQMDLHSISVFNYSRNCTTICILIGFQLYHLWFERWIISNVNKNHVCKRLIKIKYIQRENQMIFWLNSFIQKNK